MRHKRREIFDCLFFVVAKIEVKQEEQLLFHQVDLGGVEENRVTSPVLVLRGRVVEIFRGDNEGCKEDAMPRARHAFVNKIRKAVTLSYCLRTFRHFRKPGPKALQVDDGCEQGGHLDVGLHHKMLDKVLKRWQASVLSSSVGVEGRLMRCVRRCRELSGRSIRLVDDDDTGRLLSDVLHHISRDLGAHEKTKLGIDHRLW